MSTQIFENIRESKTVQNLTWLQILKWNNETEVKLVYMLHLNKWHGFPSVHLMENSDL